MKSETRLLLVHECNSNLYLAVVLRGPQRIEYVEYSDNPDMLARLVRESRYYEELRLVYPRNYANYFSNLKAIGMEELLEYVGPCKSCIDEFLRSLCKGLGEATVNLLNTRL